MVEISVHIVLLMHPIGISKISNIFKQIVPPHWLSRKLTLNIKPIKSLAISSSFVWESIINQELVSLALFSSAFGEDLLALAVFPVLQSFVFTLSVCPLSLAACSGPFIECCLLYQFLLVPSAPRVFSLSASDVFWSWPMLCWGPNKCVKNSV